MVPNFENQVLQNDKLDLINNWRNPIDSIYPSIYMTHDLTQGRHLYFC